jgi:hypothetical protein
LVKVIYELATRSMHAEEANLSAPPRAADPGLPPVQPPSGRFIVQLFVVPGAIVLGVVALLIALSSYMSSSRTPEFFLQQLDSANDDIRWRGESDLAQILKRTESGSQKWKVDAHFAMEIAERLRKAIDELARLEKETASIVTNLPSHQHDLAWGKLETQRNRINFLASALGEFHVPVGVPLLAELCTNEASPDIKGNTLQRRKAIWSLFNLGANTRAFTKLPLEKQSEALDALRAESALDTSRAAWARTALYCLSPADNHFADVVHVDAVLARCAEADDRYLREHVALAFSFWDGPLAEPTLRKLAQDDGHGTVLRVIAN